MIDKPQKTEDEQLDQRLQTYPRFLRRIEEARKSLPEGRGTRLEDL